MKQECCKNNKLFILICSLYSYSIVLQATFGDSAVSIFNLIGAIILFIIFILSNNIRSVSRNLVLWLFLSLISILISFLLVGGGIGSVVYNISLLLLVYVFYNVRLNNVDISRYLTAVKILNILLFFFVFLSTRNGGYIGGVNTNLIGMQGALCFITIALFPDNNKIIQILSLLTSVCVVVISDSRTSLGAVILFCMLRYLLSLRLFQKRKTVYLCFWITVVLGVYITYFYSFVLSDIAIVGNLVEYSTTNFNKNIFTGRELIWQLAWSKLIDSPSALLFGVGSHFDTIGELELGSNFHNSFFTIFICLGLVGYLTLMKCFFILFKGNPKVIRNKGNFPLLCLSPLFIGFFESVLFGGSIAIQLCMIILLCHLKQNNNFFIK